MMCIRADLWFYNIFCSENTQRLLPKGMNGIFYYFLMFSAKSYVII